METAKLLLTINNCYSMIDYTGQPCKFPDIKTV